MGQEKHLLEHFEGELLKEVGDLRCCNSGVNEAAMPALMCSAMLAGLLDCETSEVVAEHWCA